MESATRYASRICSASSAISAVDEYGPDAQ